MRQKPALLRRKEVLPTSLIGNNLERELTRCSCQPLRGLCAPVSLGLAALCLLNFAALRPAAAATNLVQDPGFEVATSTTQASAGHSFDGGDWFATGNDAEVFDDAAFAHSGNNSAELTLFTTGGVIQTIGTTAGQIYTLSFDADADYTGNTFDVLFDGTPVPGSPVTIPNKGDGTANYSGYTFNVTAPTNSSTLEFDATSVGNTFLDDVSLTPNAPPPATAVPEPGSLALLTLGLLPVGVLAARRRTSRRR